MELKNFVALEMDTFLIPTIAPNSIVVLDQWMSGDSLPGKLWNMIVRLELFGMETFQAATCLPTSTQNQNVGKRYGNCLKIL